MTTAMAERSHLSIGEVLSLLQDDFPDVTISKIRFLESQGLLDPERTPSGYRKFYEGDIERLRWILRHQRDHFLPLKVMKDRLEAAARDGLVVPPDEPPAPARTVPSLFEQEGAGRAPEAPPSRASTRASTAAALIEAPATPAAPPKTPAEHRHPRPTPTLPPLPAAAAG
ncbi:MAG: MerR family transcriptional regulator, partial [Acidimicrobiales bacterium]